MIQLFKPYISESAIDEVIRTLKSGWIGEGPKTKQFEQAFAEYVGCRYAVAVNSATAALNLATLVSDIKEGDEVLTSPMTFVSTNHAILYRKAVPVFVDIEPTTLNLDLTKAEKAITSKTKAILVTHYAGNPVSVNQLYKFAEEHNLKVIQDAAHACGATDNGLKIGAIGLCCFSFHAVKNLPTGDGGMITTNDDFLYRRLLKLKWVGIDKSTYARSQDDEYKWEYDVSELGYKAHMNDITASIGLEQLKYLDEWNATRKKYIALYKENLPDTQFLEYRAGSSDHLCVIFTRNRNKLHDVLAEHSIETGVHYKPNYYYSMYREYRTLGLNETEKAYQKILTLPLHLYLTPEDIVRVCEVIKKG